MEDCIGNDEMIFCAKVEQKAPIVITVTDAVPTKNGGPGHRVPTNSRV